MKPFSLIQSHNFKLLLFLARAIAIIAILLLVGSLCFIVWSIVSGIHFNALGALPLLVWSISLFVFAGVIAILISIEEHLRSKKCAM
ncbi:hypothetical protein [Alteromonas gilva]|uniref:Uncharacterized protein n=1 Tax=Alteromonas gilva TaxID=2987522 RepID=A0ABT5L2U9_9ALTE|nr:hypothetical protein [Alteromonas gilva]MDC8831361.1 hypothetical protein [Alteromonas gilva]